MFGTYLRRELVNRRKQTIIIAVGMALAIALVIIVNSVSSGVKDAQASVLQAVYGVGTDITVTQPATAETASAQQGPGGGRRFDFGAGAGTDTGAGRTVDTSRLEPTRGATVMDSTALTTVTKVPNVSAAAAVLSLTNTSFSGTLPNFQQRGEGGRGQGGTSTPPPTGGADGAGGSSFTVDSFSVIGLDPAGKSVGPLSSVTLSGGRAFSSADKGKDVVVLDAAYAKTQSKAVGDTVTIGGTEFTVVGIVAATGSDSTTAANAYIPLDVAQKLSAQTDKISSVYVTAKSSNDIAQIKADLTKALPTATVSTQADLASTVSGSLGTAGDLIASLGTWLSIIVLAAAFLIAILFTISGVTRRTREFGTLKAIGWSNRRIVGQVAGESVVQGVIGGVIGIAVGLIGVLVVNLVAPTLSGGVGNGFADAAGRAGREATGGSTAAPGGAGTGSGFGGAGGFGGGGGRFEAAGQAAASTTHIVLHAPVTVWVILIAVGLAVLGGLVAGAIGGWRASRLRPAAALRSVA